jgi:hypothetical protein
VISPKKAIAFRVYSPLNTTRRTMLQLSFVMVLVYVRNIVTRMEMAQFSVICDRIHTGFTGYASATAACAMDYDSTPTALVVAPKLVASRGSEVSAKLVFLVWHGHEVFLTAVKLMQAL